MGLTGLSVAWRLAQQRYGGPDWLALASPVLGWIALATFAIVLVGYAIKLVTAFDAVLAEFRHPIAGNLFGTPLVSLLLLPFPLAPYSLAAARAFWIVGALGMVLFAWFVVSRWMSDRQQSVHATPAWFIPVVGLLDLPLALPVLNLPPMHGLMVWALAVGLFFAVPLFTMVFTRLLFEPPLPDALKPSLLILVAPFAVGASTYTATTGQSDLFSELAVPAVAVCSGGAVGSASQSARVLPLPRRVVGGELPPRGRGHLRVALCSVGPRACRRCARFGAAGFGDGRNPRAAGANVVGRGARRTADIERLTSAGRAHRAGSPSVVHGGAGGRAARSLRSTFTLALAKSLWRFALFPGRGPALEMT